MNVFKLSSKNDVISYHFIIFAWKRDEMLVEIAIAKHIDVVCGIMFRVFIAIIVNLLFSCEINCKYLHAKVEFIFGTNESMQVCT